MLIVYYGVVNECGDIFEVVIEEFDFSELCDCFCVGDKVVECNWWGFIFVLQCRVWQEICQEIDEG